MSHGEEKPVARFEFERPYPFTPGWDELMRAADYEPPLIPGRDFYVGQRWGSEDQKREDAIIVGLTARVSAAMEAANEEDILVDWDCIADETVVQWDALAEAAVQVFLEFLREQRGQ